MAKKSIFKSLYVQVLFAIAIGVTLGHFYPETAGLPGGFSFGGYVESHNMQWLAIS